MAAACLCLDPVNGRRGRNEEPAPVRAAPVEVPDVFRDLDDAQVLTLRCEDPDAFRPRHPDVAVLVALHPVDQLARLEVSGPDAVGEDTRVRDRPVAGDVEDAD